MYSRVTTLAIFSTLFNICRPAAAFLVSNPELHGVTPFLDNYAKAQSGRLLHVDLDIPEKFTNGGKVSPSASRLYINNLAIQLKGAMPEQDRSITPMPQKSKGLSSLSRTGPLDLETHERGSFVSFQGKQTVPLENGCWEMSWTMGRPAGNIVCAFELTLPA
mmetsp:Transcript_22263/g.32523  ORF Transcript_22263/g.32523 Transcript_22263/m.32523 type:complete len:162 (+) Transcript_22263:71-556(+)